MDAERPAASAQTETDQEEKFLRIASFNTGGQAASRTQDLGELLRTVKIDIIGLQEVLVTHRPLKVKGYTWVPGLEGSDRPQNHRGLGVLVRSHLKGMLTVVSRNTVHEFMWLKLAGSGNVLDTYICVLYRPHSCHIAERRTTFYADLLEACSSYAVKGDVLLLGDFNARVKAVSGDREVNQNGPLLLECLRFAFADGEEGNYQCLLNASFGQSGIPTFSARGQQSIVDYFVTAKESLFRVRRVHVETTTHKLGANAIGSDHHLLFLDWKVNVTTQETSTPTRFFLASR